MYNWILHIIIPLYGLVAYYWGRSEGFKKRERTIGYCTKPGIRDKFSDHTCLVGDLEWPKPRANVGRIDV